MKRVLFLLCLMVISQIALAHAAEIKISRSSYLPGETFQSEISGKFSKPLTVQNIVFSDSEGREISLAFYLLEISRNENYSVYVDFPLSIAQGTYRLSVKNALYTQDGKLKGDTFMHEFEINQSIALAYKSARDSLGSLAALSSEDNALALLAFSYDASLSAQVKQELIKKGKNSECWPSASCKVKDTSLALIALSNSGSIDSSWLIDARNDMDTGLWELQASSPLSQECGLIINNNTEDVNLTSGSNALSLDLKNKPNNIEIKLNCSSSLNSAGIVHTYLGDVRNFAMNLQASSASASFNNMKCYGKEYRTSCDAEATAYAVLALSRIGQQNSKATDWIKNNAQTTKEKALALYASGTDSLEDWLVNNQHEEGYFSSKSLAESTIADFESTVFSSYALDKQNNKASEKAESWLLDEIASANIHNKLLALAFIFGNDKIESLIAVSPGMIKTNLKILKLDFRNNGVNNVNVSAVISASKEKQEIKLMAGLSGKMEFNLSKVKTSSEIAISYNKLLASKSELAYSIPLLLAEQGNISTPELPVLAEHFKFLTAEINATLLKGEKTLVKITLRNISPKPIRGITMTYTRDLRNIVNITPSKIDELDAGTDTEIEIAFESSKEGNYSGIIEAESSSENVNTSLYINLEFTKNSSLVNTSNIPDVKNKTCRDYNGTICKADETCTGESITLGKDKCCLKTCAIEKKSYSVRIIGISMIVLAFIIIIVFAGLKLRKPKKEMKDVLQDIEKKYDKYRQPAQGVPKI